MQPVKFPEATNTLQKPSGMTDEECGPLPVHNDGTISISCWKMTLKERLSALFFGKVWLYVVAGYSQPPVSLLATKTVFEKPAKYHIGRLEEFFIGIYTKLIDMRHSFRIWRRKFER